MVETPLTFLAVPLWHIENRQKGRKCGRRGSAGPVHTPSHAPHAHCHHPRPGTQACERAQPPLCLLPARSHRSGLAHKEPSVWAVRWPASLPPAQGHYPAGPPAPTLLGHLAPTPGRSSSRQCEALAQGTDTRATLVTWPLSAPRARAMRPGRGPAVVSWMHQQTRGPGFKAL